MCIEGWTKWRQGYVLIMLYISCSFLWNSLLPTRFSGWLQMKNESTPHCPLSFCLPSVQPTYTKSGFLRRHPKGSMVHNKLQRFEVKQHTDLFYYTCGYDKVRFSPPSSSHSRVPAGDRQHFKCIPSNPQSLPTAIWWSIWKRLKLERETLRWQLWIFPRLKTQQREKPLGKSRLHF